MPWCPALWEGLGAHQHCLSQKVLLRGLAPHQIVGPLAERALGLCPASRELPVLARPRPRPRYNAKGSRMGAWKPRVNRPLYVISRLDGSELQGGGRRIRISKSFHSQVPLASELCASSPPCSVPQVSQ